MRWCWSLFWEGWTHSDWISTLSLQVLCIQGFLTCRKHAERIILLVEMMQVWFHEGQMPHWSHFPPGVYTFIDLYVYVYFPWFFLSWVYSKFAKWSSSFAWVWGKLCEDLFSHRQLIILSLIGLRQPSSCDTFFSFQPGLLFCDCRILDVRALKEVLVHYKICGSVSISAWQKKYVSSPVKYFELNDSYATHGFCESFSFD